MGTGWLSAAQGGWMCHLYSHVPNLLPGLDGGIPPVSLLWTLTGYILGTIATDVVGGILGYSPSGHSAWRSGPAMRGMGVGIHQISDKLAANFQ